MVCILNILNILSQIVCILKKRIFMTFDILLFIPLQANENGGSKLNLKKKSTHTCIWCQRICLSVCLLQILTSIIFWRARAPKTVFLIFLASTLMNSKMETISKKFAALAAAAVFVIPFLPQKLPFSASHL